MNRGACILAVFLFGIALSGCGTRKNAAHGPDAEESATKSATPPPAVNAVTAPGPAQPTVGRVTPIPNGCLSMEFFSTADDSRCKRDHAGRIHAVITPTGRSESLLKQWSLADFERAIFAADRTGAGHLPGPEAWQAVKKHLQPADEIYTFGVLDSGFVITRDNRLFCMVVAGHQW